MFEFSENPKGCIVLGVTWMDRIRVPYRMNLSIGEWSFKPLSVTTNVVGLQTDDAGHVGQKSSAHVAFIVGCRNRNGLLCSIDSVLFLNS